MTILTIPRSLREKLGDDATDAFVHVINSAELDGKKDLATKTDLFEVKTALDSKIDNVQFELYTKIDKLDNKIDSVHAEINSKIDKLDSKIDSVHAELNGKIDKSTTELNSKIDKSISELNSKIDKLDSKIDKSTTELKSDIKLLQWMIGIMFAGVLSLVMKAFF